jgi:Slime mold cyclic AMP receptor
MVEQTHEFTQITFGVSGSIGFLCSLSLLVITLYKLVYNRRLPLAKTFSTVLLLNLCVADMLTGIFFMLTWAHDINSVSNPHRDGKADACNGEGFLRTLSEPASVFWTCCICFSMYSLLRRGRKMRGDGARGASMPLDRYLKISLAVFVCVCWLLPLCVAAAFWATNNYSNLGYWCWIGSGTLRFVMFYGTLIVAFCFNLLMFALMLRHNDLANYRSLTLDLFWYVPAFLYVWMPTIVYAGIEVGGGIPPPWLDELRALAEPLQGLFNLLVWVLVKYFSSATPASPLADRCPRCLLSCCIFCPCISDTHVDYGALDSSGDDIGDEHNSSDSAHFSNETFEDEHRLLLHDNIEDDIVDVSRFKFFGKLVDLR